MRVVSPSTTVPKPPEKSAHSASGAKPVPRPEAGYVTIVDKPKKRILSSQHFPETSLPKIREMAEANPKNLIASTSQLVGINTQRVISKEVPDSETSSTAIIITEHMAKHYSGHYSGQLPPSGFDSSKAGTDLVPLPLPETNLPDEPDPQEESGQEESELSLFINSLIKEPLTLDELLNQSLLNHNHVSEQTEPQNNPVNYQNILTKQSEDNLTLSKKNKDLIEKLNQSEITLKEITIENKKLSSDNKALTSQVNKLEKCMDTTNLMDVIISKGCDVMAIKNFISKVQPTLNEYINDAQNSFKTLNSTTSSLKESLVSIPSNTENKDQADTVSVHIDTLTENHKKIEQIQKKNNNLCQNIIDSLSIIQEALIKESEIYRAVLGRNAKPPLKRKMTMPDSTPDTKQRKTF